MIYNCGKEAGCSRLHKHLQILPKPEEWEEGWGGMWPDCGGVDLGKLPFRLFVRYLRRDDEGEGDAGPGMGAECELEELVGAHERLLGEAGEAYHGFMGCDGNASSNNTTPNITPDTAPNTNHSKSTPSFPHNVIITKRWMAVVPRRRAEVEGASANAAGMMGMVWMATEMEVEPWRVKGPGRMLGELGIPNC